MNDRRNWLYLLMGLSLVPVIIVPISFIVDGFFELQDFLWIAGAWIGLFSYMLLFWQYVLGLKSVAYFFTKDIVATNHLHKILGIYGFTFLLIHPLTLILSPTLNRGLNLVFPNLNSSYYFDVFIGEMAFILVFTILLTSHWLRAKFSFRWWKRIHLINYIILPLVYLHSDDIGTFFSSKPLAIYFKLLLFVYILILLYRCGLQLGVFKYKYRVSHVTKVTYDTIKLDLQPNRRFIIPLPGQFIQIQTRLFGETHPFTASTYDETTHLLSISVKATGPFSKSIADLHVGQTVWLDGPYGVFTREAYLPTINRIVLIAGGIGITPFLRLIDFIGRNPAKFREVLLLYGNKTEVDMAFKDQIEQITNKANLKVVHVLSNENNTDKYEKGFINTGLIKKYVDEDLINYEYFICGPPIMMSKVKADLLKNHVKVAQVHLEEFSW